MGHNPFPRWKAEQARAKAAEASRERRGAGRARFQLQVGRTGERVPRGHHFASEAQRRSKAGAQQREGQSTEERRAKAGRQRNSKRGPSRQLQADRLAWGEPQEHHLASREQQRRQKNQQCKRQSIQQQGKRQAMWGGLPGSSRRDSIHWLF